MFLPEAVAGEQEVRVAAGEGDDLRGHVLGQAVGELLALDVNDFAHTGDLAGRLRCGSGIQAGHQHMHVAAALAGGGHGVQGRRADAGVVVFCND